MLTGAAGLIGSHGVVVERLAPEGWVRLGDQRWNARGDSVIEAGTEVEITGLDRLTLRVRPAAKEAHS